MEKGDKPMCVRCAKNPIATNDYREIPEELLESDSFSSAILWHRKRPYAEFKVCWGCWVLEDKAFWIHFKKNNNGKAVTIDESRGEFRELHPRKRATRILGIRKKRLGISKTTGTRDSLRQGA